VSGVISLKKHFRPGDTAYEIDSIRTEVSFGLLKIEKIVHVFEEVTIVERPGKKRKRYLLERPIGKNTFMRYAEELFSKEEVVAIQLRESK
jgi:hypothetical protein